MRNGKSIIFGLLILIMVGIGTTSAIIVMPDLTTFKGYTRDQFGNPIPYATVKILANNVVVYTKTSSSSGYYSIYLSTSSSKYYKVTASKTGYTSGTVNIGYVNLGSYYHRTVTLKKSISTTFRGYVKDEEVTSKALNGATVKLYKSGSLLQTATASSNGYYTFNSVSDYGNTEYVIKASINGYTTKDFTVSSRTYSSTYYKYCYLNRIEKYAVLVGISEYNTIDDAFGATNYIGIVYDFLVNRFNFDEVWILGGSNATQDFPNLPWSGLATKSNIRSHVQNMASIADSNDIIMFYYAGHGGNSLLNKHDYTMTVWDGYSSTSSNYNDDELENDISNTDAAKIYLSFDSCHSGGVINNFDGRSDEDKYLITTSCKAGEVSYGGDLGPYWSVFLWTELVDLGTDSLETIFSEANTRFQNFMVIHTQTPQIFDGDGINNNFFIHPY